MGQDELAPARVSTTSHGGQALKSSIKLQLALYLGDYMDDVLVECVARLSARPNACCREFPTHASSVRWVGWFHLHTRTLINTARLFQICAGDGGARKDPPGNGG